MTAPSRRAGPVLSAPPRRFFRPTWAEVDLGALASNLRRLRARVGPRVKTMLVVKGNAYGHGAVATARAVQESRAAQWLGVSSVEEGIALREAGIRLPILVLGSLYPFESFLAAVEYGLTPTVASLEGAQRLREAAARVGRTVACHLKLDTGMGRIGMGWPSGLRVVEALSRGDGAALGGVYTHFAKAESDPETTRLQLERFEAALGDIARAGIRVPLRHAANSAGALKHPAARLDMIRPGLAAYGLFAQAGPGFRTVLSLKTKVVFIKNVRAGTPVSYGGTFKTRRASRIATLPVGYADGYPRALSNKAAVLIGGRRCPVVGTITMDMMMVDATALPEAHVGDEAVLIGSQGRETVGAAELASLCGTIPYEIVTGLSSRVPRVLLQPGRGA